MPVAIAASLVGLVVALIAYYRDAPLEQRRLEAPTWDVLPDPAEVARTEFPLAFPGYEPATVEFHFDLLARAYADLLAVAPPDVVEKARHRAAVRQGIDLPGDTTSGSLPPPAAAVAAGSHSTAAPRRPLATGIDVDDAEALRTEAALAELHMRPRPEPER